MTEQKEPEFFTEDAKRQQVFNELAARKPPIPGSLRYAVMHNAPTLHRRFAFAIPPETGIREMPGLINQWLEDQGYDYRVDRDQTIATTLTEIEELLNG